MTPSITSYAIEAVWLRQPYTCRQTIRKVNSPPRSAIEDSKTLIFSQSLTKTNSQSQLDDVNDAFDLRSGIAQIIICTEACGPALDVRNIYLLSLQVLLDDQKLVVLIALS